MTTIQQLELIAKNLEELQNSNDIKYDAYVLSMQMDALVDSIKNSIKK